MIVTLWTRSSSAASRHTALARLVVGRVCALFLGHHHRAALGAHDDLVLGHLEIVHVDQALVLARGEEGRLVDEVGEVGAGEARCAARDDVGLDVRRQRHLPHVHQENLLAAADVGQRHHHLAIEAAGACAVSSTPDGWSRRSRSRPWCPRAVHFPRSLVQRLLALVVAAAQARAALAATARSRR